MNDEKKEVTEEEEKKTNLLLRVAVASETLIRGYHRMRDGFGEDAALLALTLAGDFASEHISEQHQELAAQLAEMRAVASKKKEAQS